MTPSAERFKDNPGFHYLRCGCRDCVDEMNRLFSSIVLPQWTREEEQAAEMRAEMQVNVLSGQTFTSAPMQLREEGQ